MALLGEVHHHRRVEVAGTGSHHQAFQRGETHRGVDHLAVLDRRHAAAVAEVAGDQRHVFLLLAEEFGGRQRDVTVAGSVESVFSNAVLLVVFVGNRVKIRFGRHGHVELRVEDPHIRNVRHGGFAGFDSGEVGRVVQRPERNVFADDLLDPRIDFDRFGDLLAAEQHAVPDRDDFVEVLEHAVGRIDQLGADRLQRFFQVLHRDDSFELEPVGDALVDHIGLIGAEAFKLPFRQNRVVRHREQRELHRAAARIDDQYLHFSPSLSFPAL